MKVLFLFYSLFVLQSDVPELNGKIMDFVNKSIGKKIGTGECWDLAAEALEYSGAFHDRTSEKTIYIFGKEFDPKKDKVYPGDIVQMKNITLRYEKDNAIYTETMTLHTAIIFEVRGSGDFEIAHQNTSYSGKKVGLSSFRLRDIKSGKVTFYRPYKK